MLLTPEARHEACRCVSSLLSARPLGPQGVAIAHTVCKEKKKTPTGQEPQVGNTEAQEQPSSSSERQRERVEGGTQAAGMAVVTKTSSRQADHMQKDGHPVGMTAA